MPKIFMFRRYRSYNDQFRRKRTIFTSIFTCFSCRVVPKRAKTHQLWNLGNQICGRFGEYPDNRVTTRTWMVHIESYTVWTIPVVLLGVVENCVICYHPKCLGKEYNCSYFTKGGRDWWLKHGEQIAGICVHTVHKARCHKNSGLWVREVQSQNARCLPKSISRLQGTFWN